MCTLSMYIIMLCNRRSSMCYYDHLATAVKDKIYLKYYMVGMAKIS